MQRREVERRRYQDQPLDDDVDVMRQGLRHRRSAEPAIALADKIDRRGPALVPGRARAGRPCPSEAMSACTSQKGLSGFSSLPLPRLKPVPTGSTNTRSVKPSQVAGLSTRRTGGLGTAPFSGVSKICGPRAPRCRKTEAAPGPPLKTKLTGRSRPVPGRRDSSTVKIEAVVAPFRVGHRQGLGDRLIVEPVIAEGHRVTGRHPRRKLAIRLFIRPDSGRLRRSATGT